MPRASVESLIKPDRYQVFLMACPATFPFTFATHPWLVINRKGIVSRHGVGYRQAPLAQRPGLHSCTAGCAGHLHKDSRAPSEGIEVFPFFVWPTWNGHVVASIEGGEGSVAARMVEVIAGSAQTYPYRHRYRFLGPNSNTYAAWALNQFPESGIRLPWNAFGKGYKA